MCLRLSLGCWSHTYLPNLQHLCYSVGKLLHSHPPLTMDGNLHVDGYLDEDGGWCASTPIWTVCSSSLSETCIHWMYRTLRKKIGRNCANTWFNAMRKMLSFGLEVAVNWIYLNLQQNALEFIALDGVGFENDWRVWWAVTIKLPIHCHHSISIWQTYNSRKT